MDKKLRTAAIVFVVLIILYLTLPAQDREAPWKLFTDTHRRHPVSVENVTRISEWMTFDYINEVFDLPASYLQESLAIDDEAYPHLTIGQYSKNKNIHTGILIEQIQESIRSKIKQEQPH